MTKMCSNLSLVPTRAALYVGGVPSESDRESLRRGVAPGACGSVRRWTNMTWPSSRQQWQFLWLNKTAGTTVFSGFLYCMCTSGFMFGFLKRKP